MTRDEKHRELRRIISRYRSVAVAFSGGVDSALLLKIACDTLGSVNVVALTAVSPIFAAYEIECSRQFAKQLGVRQQLIESHQMTQAEFIANSPRRCLHCKLGLFSQFLDTVAATGAVLLEGSNRDDLETYRPGREAIQQLQIVSPLLEAGLTKYEIRMLSRQLQLPTWNKPATPCLATRFPYHDPLTVDKLKQLEYCEEWLRQQGFENFRVRNHQQLARIEIDPDEFHRVTDAVFRDELIKVFKTQHFNYVTIDLQGYRSGSLDETLSH